MPKDPKIVFLGSEGSGKTCLVSRAVRGTFLEEHTKTIGASFLTHLDGEMKWEVWDTAGDEKYSGMASMYYHGAAAVVIVYDTTSIDSFARAQRYVEEVKKSMSEKGDSVIMLAGNKSDLTSDVTIGNSKAEQYAQDNGILFTEVSAKLGTNTRELWDKLQLDVNEKSTKARTETKIVSEKPMSAEIVDSINQLEEEYQTKLLPPSVTIGEAGFIEVNDDEVFQRCRMKGYLIMSHGLQLGDDFPAEKQRFFGLVYGQNLYFMNSDKKSATDKPRRLLSLSGSLIDMKDDTVSIKLGDDAGTTYTFLVDMAGTSADEWYEAFLIASSRF
jgi:Ras-related protein Rab-5C